MLKLVTVVHHRFSLWSIPDWFTDALQADFANLRVVNLKDYDRLPEEIVDADILMAWSLRPEQVRPARKLRWIHSTAAAIHALLIPEVVNSDIDVTNSSDVHGGVVAEHAIALMMAMAKRLPSVFRYQGEKRWGQEALWAENPRPRELIGATLVVLGLGAIGREVSRVAVALGMHVIAVRENPEKGAESASEVIGFADMDAVLPGADFVVLAAPVTTKTERCFNAARFALMKRDAYLINVARGALVDQDALVEAIQSRSIAGAALDVFDEEPLPASSPLWEMENVLITPHSAALTERMWERHYERFAENLRRFKAGEPLLGVVDKQKGY